MHIKKVRLFDFKVLLAIFLSLFNLAAIVVISWASVRGLDLSDESFYYLGYLYYNHIPDLSPSSFHLIYARFFSFFELDLTGVRLLRLFLTLLASFVLFLGIQKLQPKGKQSDSIMLFNIVLSGMLLSYAWAPLALSYNSMSTIYFASAIGIWLLSLNTTLRWKSVCWSLLGALFVLFFFVKISNIILFPLLLAGSFYWYYKKGSQKKVVVKTILWCSISFVIGVFLVLTFISNGIFSIPQTLDFHFQQLVGVANTDSKYSIAYLWHVYTFNLEMMLLKLKVPLFILFSLFLLVQAYNRIKKPKSEALSTSLFAISGILIFMVFVFQNEYWSGGTTHEYTMLIPYIFAILFLLLNRYNEKGKVNLLLLLGLICIPLAGSIGTNNGLSAQVLFYAVFPFLMVYYLASVSKNKWFSFLMMTFITLMSTAQIISATITRPYRQSALTGHNQKLTGTTALQGIHVDETLLKLQENLQFLETHDSKYVFVYARMMGVNLLIDKKPYSLEWFNEGNDQKTCAIIEKSKIPPNEIIFLIPEELPLSEEIISCLSAKGVHLQTDYSKVKSFKYYNAHRKKEMTMNVYLYTSE